ncbi:MAG: hypothetical protein RLN86_10025 [Cyclobacteriaceae bacterium]
MIDFIQRKKNLSFWISCIFLIVAGSLMRPSSICLKTDVTPLAILDIEFAFEQARANIIRDTWSKITCKYGTALKAAQINIAWDFLFIVAYVIFFIVLILLLVPLKARFWRGLMIYMAVLAGLLDVLENIFMYLFLRGADLSSLLFSIPATMKFASVFVLVSSLVAFLISKAFTASK